MFKLNAKFDADSLLYSVILNATGTQYTRSLNGIYHPHWLVQWHHHCSHRHIPVHSPWLPGYIYVVWTILVILTMAGLFLDRPRMDIMGMYIDLCIQDFFEMCLTHVYYLHNFVATDLIKLILSPGQVVQLVGASSCIPKRLRVWFLVRVYT